MEVFGLVGLPFGLIAFVFALNATNQVAALEKRLIDAGLLEREKQSG